MNPTLAIHIRFGMHLVDESVVARSVAEIISRPCFGVLDRLTARLHGKCMEHAEPTVLGVARHLTNSFVDAALLDAKDGRELVAVCEIENGTRVRDMMPPSIRYAVMIAVPFIGAEASEVVAAACELAVCLRAGAGYIALEPCFGWAYEIALGRPRSRDRPGLSFQRSLERHTRSLYEERLATELGGVEWGTFLGAGHLAWVSAETVRTSGVFARVERLSPDLVYLQVTQDAADDLTLALEERLVAARKVLAPVLMPVDGISLA